MESEFVFDVAPTAAVHASSIVETPRGLIAAWFGGSCEGHDDVAIWIAERPARARRWSEPRRVATGEQLDGGRYPCWNPVLHRLAGGTLLLFYKVGPDPRRWWGMVMRSADDGLSWELPQRLPSGFFGPIKNKPIETTDGVLICPSSSEHRRWRVHLEYSRDEGRTWSGSGPLNSGRDFAAIQPCILRFARGYQLLCRSRQGVIAECWSKDAAHWSAMRATSLPNPDSGIDAVNLPDGRGLLVYNHSKRKRTPLNVAVSADGASWSPLLVLEREAGEFSYPAVIVDAAGRIHIAYTWNRQTVGHAIVDPRELCRLA